MALPHRSGLLGSSPQPFATRDGTANIVMSPLEFSLAAAIK